MTDHSLEDSSEATRAELDEVHLLTVIAVRTADTSSVEDISTPVSSPKHGNGPNRKRIRTNKWKKNRFDHHNRRGILTTLNSNTLPLKDDLNSALHF